MFDMGIQHACCGECVVNGCLDVWGADVWDAEFFATELDDVHEFPVRVPVLRFPASCVGVCGHCGYGGLPYLFGGG